MIYFSSDHHFQHANIIQHCNRPYKTQVEMDLDLIEKWNSVVKEKDEVYYLGDFTLGNWATAWSYLKKLKGRKYFIKGNHDNNWYSSLDSHQKLPPIHELKVNNQLYILSHYPMRAWNKSFHGSYHIFGHEHGNLPPHGLSFDIGVDCWDGYPVSIEEVNERMESIKYEKSDV